MYDGDDDKELEEIEVLAELAEILGPGTEPSTNGAKSSQFNSIIYFYFSCKLFIKFN